MKQLHVVNSIAQGHGGLGLAALRYSESIANRGGEVSLFVVNRDASEFVYDKSCRNFSVLDGLPVGGSKSLISFLSKVKSLYKAFHHGNYELLHIHGMWSPILAVSSILAWYFRVPVVLSPHGSLESWALKHKGLKKNIALAVYQKAVLKNADLLVATAPQELMSIRAIGLRNPVAVVPNGVDTVPSVKPQLKGDIRSILFLSRVHPVKGLMNLIQAWKKVRRDGWRITIAGPDEMGHTKELVALIQAEGLEEDFEFCGLVVGEEKERRFAEADIFVLPTFSENFGIAVAEALARGIPVIATTGAPWEDLKTFECGWWVAPTIDGISHALDSAMSLSRPALAEMGERGVRLILEKYSWDIIGARALAAGQWVVKKNRTPDFIDII